MEGGAGGPFLEEAHLVMLAGKPEVRNVQTLHFHFVNPVFQRGNRRN